MITGVNVFRKVLKLHTNRNHGLMHYTVLEAHLAEIKIV